MAKRFTDTGKWDKESFASLPCKMKLAWIYICDKCDHAGIWDANFRLMVFQIGEEISAEDFRQYFGDKIEWLSSSKIFIPAFVEFQYGALNPENRVHASILNQVKKLAPNKDLLRPFQGSMDKDKDKEHKKKRGVGKNKAYPPELLAAYRDYPLKKGKTKGLDRFLANHFPDEIPQFHSAVCRYRDDCKANGTEPQFIKHFPTFVGEWRDWLDPETGTSDIMPAGGKSIEEIIAEEMR